MVSFCYKNSYADADPIRMLNGYNANQEGYSEVTDRYVRSTDEQERTAKSVYEKKVQSSEFEEFLRYLDMTEYELVRMYPTYDERITKFFQWKVNRNML